MLELNSYECSIMIKCAHNFKPVNKTSREAFLGCTESPYGGKSIGTQARDPLANQLARGNLDFPPVAHYSM